MMYIFEAENEAERLTTLLAVVNAYYQSQYTTLAQAEVIPGFFFLDHSETTKTGKISIKDTLALKKAIALRSAGLKLAMINNAHNLTTESQNSLLKTLEELPETTMVILALPDKRKLLPTILSRGIPLKTHDIKALFSNPDKEIFPPMVYNREGISKDLGYIKDFLGLSLFDQFAYITTRLEKNQTATEKNHTSPVNKLDLVESFMLDLLSYYEHQLLSEEANTDKTIKIVELLESCIRKLHQGVNEKALLAYIILMLNDGSTTL